MHMILSLACDALVPVGPESGPGLGAAGHPSCAGWVIHLPSVSWVCTVPAATWSVLGKSTDINPNKPKAEEEEITDTLPDNGRKKP